MHTHADNAIAQKSSAVAGQESRTTNKKTVNQLMSDRDEDTLQMKWQDMADNSAQVRQLKQQQQMADVSPHRLMQRKQADAVSSSPKFAAQLQQKAVMGVGNVLQAKPAAGTTGLRMVSLSHTSPVQRRTIPEIQADLTPLQAISFARLSDYPTTTAIDAKQELINNTRTTLGRLSAEILAQKALRITARGDRATDPNIKSVAAINAELASLSDQITSLNASIAGGSLAARPERPAAAWGAAGLARRPVGPAAAAAPATDPYMVWQTLNSQLPANTAARTSAQAQHDKRTADLPVAGLIDAENNVKNLLDSAQADVDRGKEERYFHDLITTMAPTSAEIKPEKDWGKGPSHLGTFKYSPPPEINGIARSGGYFEIHIHKPQGTRTVWKVHIRGDHSRFNRMNIFESHVAVHPRNIPGWQGDVVRRLFTMI